MKQTPQEIKVSANFGSGKITQKGFMGTDTRHIHAIIEEDRRTLYRLNWDENSIADRLQYFIEEGKKGLETIVDLDDFTVQVVWHRGLMPCPFGEMRLHHKIVGIVRNKKLGKEIKFTQLNVHMIRKHGFFEGRGSPFRLDPEELIEFLTG